jgi:hypothetical protein
VVSAQTTAFYFTGAGGYVAGGVTATLDASDGYTITGSTNYQGGDSFDISSGAPDYIIWSVDFSNASETTLTLGLYTNATRYPFNVSPYPPDTTITNGLSFVGDGRADNTLTGEFDVLQATYSQTGVLLSFAADFIQDDEGSPTSRDYGSIRFNSTVPLDIPSSFPDSLPVTPEPSTWALLLGSLGLLAFLHQRTQRA